MTTKTKTKTISQLLAEAEQKHLNDLEAAHVAVEAARIDLEAAERAHEAAFDRAGDVRADIKAGDNLVTAEDLANANEAATFAGLALKGAKARLQQAERAVTGSIDSDIAQSMVAALQRILPGVDVLPTFAPAPLRELELSEVPVVLIRQSAEPKVISPSGIASGWVSAQIELIHYASVIHRELRERDVENALREAGIEAKVNRRSWPDDEDPAKVTKTVFRVDVANVFPKIPALLFKADMLTSDLAEELASSLRPAAPFPIVDSKQAHLDKELTDEHGVTKTKVDIDLVMVQPSFGNVNQFGQFGTDPYGPGGSSTSAWASLAGAGGNAPKAPSPSECVSTLLGRGFSHLGRVTGVELTRVHIGDRKAEYAIAVELTHKAAR